MVGKKKKALSLVEVKVKMLFHW